MNLEELVPPLELCKKIPAGEFADSALGYHRYCIKDGKEYYKVTQRGNTHSLTDVQYPAPTVIEIMKNTPNEYCDPLFCSYYGEPNKVSDEDWGMGNCERDLYIKNGSENRNPAASALMWWFKQKEFDV